MNAVRRRLSAMPGQVLLITSRWSWRKDLAEILGLSEGERTGFLLVLEWFENFRLRHQLEAGREAARTFWKLEVKREGCTRETWQLDQWARLRCATPWQARSGVLRMLVQSGI